MDVEEEEYDGRESKEKGRIGEKRGGKGVFEVGIEREGWRRDVGGMNEKKDDGLRGLVERERKRGFLSRRKRINEVRRERGDYEEKRLAENEGKGEDLRKKREGKGKEMSARRRGGMKKGMVMVKKRREWQNMREGRGFEERKREGKGKEMRAGRRGGMKKGMVMVKKRREWQNMREERGFEERKRRGGREGGFERRERESCVPIVFSPSQLTEINDGTFLLYTPRILFRKI
jgi:hypothetical protein